MNRREFVAAATAIVLMPLFGKTSKAGSKVNGVRLTHVEQKMWKMVQELGIHEPCIAQYDLKNTTGLTFATKPYAIGSFRLDFAFPTAKKCIEIWPTSMFKEGMEKELALHSIGWKTYTVQDVQILNDPEHVKKVLKWFMNEY